MSTYYGRHTNECRVKENIKCCTKVRNTGPADQRVEQFVHGPVFRTFVQYLITFCSRPETASDVISGLFVGMIVPEKPVTFRDPRLNLSQAIPPEAVEAAFLLFSG